MGESRVPSREYYSSVIIGGGFFGCALALFLTKRGRKVLVIEREDEILKRASFNNQARVHQGYHYPRHFLTALRSHVNFPRFVKDYEACIVNNFDAYYAISAKNSKTNATQFSNFIQRTGAPLERASKKITKLFNPHLIEEVFKVEEFAFDSNLLRKQVANQLAEAQIEVVLNSSVKKVQKGSESFLKVSGSTEASSFEVNGERVYNCTYSGLNDLLHDSNVGLLPLKHELTEMCLVSVPDELKNFAVTVMCGAFFSLMPFPPRGLHTLSHVRFTPHGQLKDDANHFVKAEDCFNGFEKKSAFKLMQTDAARYLPMLAKVVHQDSLWEMKTTLQANEQSDGRPILFRRNFGLDGFHSILGGKIDNIYEVFEEIERYGE